MENHEGSGKLFLDELSVLHDSEKQPVSEFTAIAEAAIRNDLQELLLKHLDHSESNVDKPGQIYTAFEEVAIIKSCQITAALLCAWVRVVVDFKDSFALNTAVVAYAQKIEHHKITSLGSLYEWAVLLGNRDAAGLLDELRNREKSTNQALIKQDRLHFDQRIIDEEDGMTCNRYGQRVSADVEAESLFLPGFSFLGAG